MIVNKNNNNIKVFNEKYCGFHDGKIINFGYLSGIKPLRNYPWEKIEALPESKGEILNSTFYASICNPQIRIGILFNNYEWPNQNPNRVIVLTLSDITNVGDFKFELIGKDIFDFYCEIVGDAFQFNWIEHDHSSNFRTMENGRKLILFKCKRFKIVEKIFTK